MRWDNLKVEDEAQRLLPGYRDPAAVRRFDAPEALDTRFYEVRAKSVLNKVPPASQMPFRWTVNPYRGCTHACLYCMWGGALVLMADGRNRNLEDLAVGDRIVGTRREGHYRRFVETEVLAKWSSIKPAWQVELSDGTKLIASGDHRFLSDRGWKYVQGAEHGALQRSFLTEKDTLLGPGGCVDAPAHDDEYERGYLTGMIRGDATLGMHGFPRPGRGSADVHRFRLAGGDDEALLRSQSYLDDFDVETDRFVFSAAESRHREVTAVRMQRPIGVERIRDLIEWPRAPSVSWTKGFLAGILDAEGSDGEVIRLADADPETIDRVLNALSLIGFDHEIESSPNTAVTSVRIRGGLPAKMRLFLATDPAITRKRAITGQALESKSNLRVVSIRPLGIVMRMYDITTGTEDFIANGVVSHNCFARPTHTFLGFDAGRDFEREIVVKVNAPELLRAELARPSWKGEHVALGTNTDPYQWVEGRYKLMEGIWQTLLDARNPCSILTKSPLLLRDISLLKELAEKVGLTACLSIPTLDQKVWRETEPRTPNPRARLEAVAELNRAGVPTGVLVAPLMPGINDAPEQVEPLLDAIADAGATNVAGIALHLRGEVKDVFMGWMRDSRPELLSRYEELYGRRAYAPQPERERLARMTRRGERPGAFWRNRGLEGRRTTDTGHPPERSVAERVAALSGQQALF